MGSHTTYPFSLLAILCVGLPLPAAAIPSTDCTAAADIDIADLVSTTYTEGVAQMADERSSLGIWTPFFGGTMCIISSGDTPNITTMQDHDWPGAGLDTSAGDKITIEWVLDVPPWANSFYIRSSFFSREYPEWVGQAYNDTLELWVTGSAWSGQAMYDAFGNPIQVNSALFLVTNPADLVGTGFDQDGSTGWIVTAVPADPGTTITLEMSIYDVGDGVWDSAALIDHFEWSTNTVNLPYTTHADDEGYPVDEVPNQTPPEGPVTFFATPKAVPTAGGTRVRLAGRDFTDDMFVAVGGRWVDFTFLDEETIELEVPSAREVTDGGLGGPTWIRVGDHTLLDAIVYVDGPMELGEGEVEVRPPVDDWEPPTVDGSVARGAGSCAMGGAGSGGWLGLGLLLGVLGVRRRR